jgi:hypothetical protein
MTNERRSREREGRPVFGERPAAIAAALASFGATVAFLAPAALGGSSALAEDPAVQGRAPAEVVAGFEPAIPDGRVAPAEESIDGVLVRARYVDTDGTRRIVVELKAPQGRGGEVACTVGLDGFDTPEMEMLARVPRPPRAWRAWSKEIRASLEAGQTKTVQLVLPDDVGPPAEAPTSPMLTGWRLAIDA